MFLSLCDDDEMVWGWVNKIIDLDGEDNKGITQLEVIDAKPSPPRLIKQENIEI